MRFFPLIIAIFMANIGYADDVDVTRNVMAAIAEKDYESAISKSQSAADPIVRDIALWHALRAGEGAFTDYEKFLTENGEWPGLPWMQARGEVKIPTDTDAERVIAFITHNGVQTDDGLLAVMRAYHRQGANDPAETAFKIGSQEFKIDKITMDAIANIYPDLVAKYRYAHVDYLLFEGEVDSAAEYLDDLTGEAKAIALARIRMQRDSNGINAALNALSDNAATNGGVIYDRMRYRYTHGNREGARALVLMQSTSRTRLLRPEYWAETRADMTRAALREGDGQLAYRLASNHFLKADEKGYLDLEFLSGFAALEFNGDAALARRHFENLKSASITPISAGRAGYWLGRAGDASGYAYGAKFQTSFYGQLAAEEGGIPFDNKLVTAIRPDFRGHKFMDDDNIKAALLFAAVDQPLLAHRFLAHASEAMAQSPAEAEALGQLALKIGLPHAAVNIGKNMAREGHVITHSYYPTPPFITETIKTPKSAAYAIMRQESEFYENAQSRVGARGLMQLMPATAEHTAEKEGLEFELSKLKSDPGFNVQLGTAYLAEMLAKWDGSLPLSAVSYNAGPRRASQWLETNGPIGTDSRAVVKWLELIPFDETRNYVHRVVEGVFIYDAKLRGGFGYYKPSELLAQPFPKSN